MKVVGFDSSEYETKQVFYNSKDGTPIPMFIISRKVHCHVLFFLTTNKISKYKTKNTVDERGKFVIVKFLLKPLVTHNNMLGHWSNSNYVK